MNIRNGNIATPGTQTRRDMDSIHALYGKAFTVVRRVKALECFVDLLDLIQRDNAPVLLDGEQAEAIRSGVWDTVDAARELEKAFRAAVDADDERDNSVASPAASGHPRDAEAGSRFIVDPGTPAAAQLEKMADALEELRAMSRMTHRDVREIHVAFVRPWGREDPAGSAAPVRDPVVAAGHGMLGGRAE